jgi:hypothetical protein
MAKSRALRKSIQWHHTKRHLCHHQSTSNSTQTIDKKGNSNKRMFSENGTYTLEVAGELTLVNKSEVTDELLVFDFDLTAVYN